MYCKRETWMHEFFCLADKSQAVAPNKAMKHTLQLAGLGQKKVCFSMISEYLNLWKDPVLTDRVQKGLGNSVTLLLNETGLSLSFEMLAVEQFDLKQNLLRLSAENLPVRFGLYY